MSLSRLICALSLTALVATGAVAQQATEQDLQAVEQDIALSAEKQKLLEAEAQAAIEVQESLSAKLVTFADTVTEQERKFATAEKRKAKLQNEIAAINLTLVAKQDVIAQVLAGLQRLEHNPPPALVVAPDDVLDALRGAMVFGTIVPELRRAAQELHDQLTLLKTLREKFEAESKTANETLAALEASRTEINQLIEEKARLAKTSKEQLAAERKRAEELADKATNLKDLLAKLEQERLAAEAKRTAEEKARAEAARKAEEAKIKPTVMAKAQGQLRFPAEGQIVRKFGDDTGLGSRVDGNLINTIATAQVTTPVAGKIEFAGKFRSYGQMIIINPGGDYLVLLAGLSDIQATLGQSIREGEPVGRMGEKPGKLAVSNGLTNLTNPVLYVEFRFKGNPVDPAPWWIGNRQEAMR
jgi:murein hydrolase activator